MKRLRKKMGIILMMSMLVSFLTPAIPAEAAEEPYLAYQTAWDGTPVNRMDSNMAEWYKVEKLLLRPGDQQDLCFINAGLWKDAKWKSSNTKIAKVDSKGNVTAVSDGVATITLTYKKRITNKKVSVTAKVYVGEQNWGLDAGLAKGFLEIDSLEMKVGGDLKINVYGLPEPDHPYSIDMTSSDKKVAECIGQALFARKAGTAVVTIKVKNNINGVTWTKKFDVKVTNPVMVSDNPENKYFDMYGEDYIRMFKSGCMAVTDEINKDMLDDALPELQKHEAFMGLAGLSEVANPFDNIEKIINMMFRGKEYLLNDMRKDTITNLVDEITQDTENEALLHAKQEKVKKINKLRENVKDLFGAMQAVATGKIGGDDEEFDTLLEYLLEAEVWDKEDFREKDITAEEYLITTLCLYELDGEMLDLLQQCSTPGRNLYDDIELIKQDRKKNPTKYFMEKYGSDIAIDMVMDVIKHAAGGEVAFAVKALDMFVEMLVDMAGARELNVIFEAGWLYGYLSELDSKATLLQKDIKNNGDKYSDAEVADMIKQYELMYSMVLSMIEPVFDKIQELDPKTINRELSDDKLIVKNGYDYNRHVAMAMALYYSRFGATNEPANPETVAKPQAQWSEWQDTLSSYDKNKYEIEERTLYRYRNFEITTADTATLSGWYLYDVVDAGEQYGDWSEWSTTPVSSKENRQTESKVQYSYRTKQKQKEYSDWSAWQMQPIEQGDGKEIESRTVYGYYYFFCSNCGAHMHGHGTNACYTWAEGCGSSIPVTNAVSFYHESPHTTGLLDWHGTGKYWKEINGERVFKWENYTTKEYRARTYVEGEQMVYSEWSEYGDTVWDADASTEVRTRTVYRYRDKEKSTIYYFSRWTAWSEFSTTPATASDTCMVEIKKQYRCREK